MRASPWTGRAAVPPRHELEVRTFWGGRSDSPVGSSAGDRGESNFALPCGATERLCWAAASFHEGDFTPIPHLAEQLSRVQWTATRPAMRRGVALGLHDYEI